MKKFNALVKENLTHVQINAIWYLVKSIHFTRKWLNVYGLIGSFQRWHITKFTHKIDKE